MNEIDTMADRLSEAQQQSQADRLRLREWFNFALDGCLLTDGRGIIYDANYAAAALLGARKEFLLGKPLGLFVMNQGQRLFYERLARLSEFGGVEHWEVRLCRPRDQPCEVKLTATVYPEEQDRAIKLRWMLHDVSAMRQSERDLKHAQQQMLQSERLAAIGQVVAGLAHESRNALQRIQACLALLDLRLQGQPENLELLGRIGKAQDDLQRLFDDVRNYAVEPRLQPRLCDLRAVWREAWNDLADRPEAPSAELSEDIDNVDLFCWADPFQLKQVFRNLLENALASGASPVRIVVHCRPASLGTEEAICLRLRDNGPGIPAEARRKLFEPFFTTKMRGTGLGLAICRRIIEAHGGRIAVSGDFVGGAEMVLTLPRRTP